MKTLRFLIASLVIMASGCIKVDETLTIEKNGSGNLELIYTIPEQTISQMKAMFKLRDQMDAVTGQALPQTVEDDFERIFFDPSEDQIKRLLKKYEKNGITIETLKIETRNSSKNVTLKIMFTDLARVAKADFFPQHGFSLSRNENGTYTFFRASNTEGAGFTTDAAGQGSPDFLSPILNGFRVALKVNTPGKILETNASRKALYNAGWIYDFDKDPNAVKNLQAQSMKIIFDAKGYQLPEVRQMAKAVEPRKRQ